MRDAPHLVMGIAVDQTRLRRISAELLRGEALDRTQALAIVEIVRTASGADDELDSQELAILEAIVQRVCSLAGLELGEADAIPCLPEPRVRLDLLARMLDTRGARELAYALALLVSVADLELVPRESAALEDLQHALDLDDRRATDLTVFVTEIVADAA